MITENSMINSIVDKFGAGVGATTGLILGNINTELADFGIKLCTTIILAAVGAIVGYYIQKGLKNYDKKKGKKS